MKQFIVFIYLIGVVTVPAMASDFSILPVPKKVSEHVYAWIGPYGGPNPENKGFRMNMGFVVGKDAVAVFETGFYPDMAQEMVKHIQAITKAPIKYAINSNSQPDRYFGNDVFLALGAKVIAHELEINRMKELVSNHATFLDASMKWKGKRPVIPKMPNNPIKQKEILDLGGDVKIHISFFKAAHTPSPLIIHIPKDNVVYAGDILYSGRLLAVVPGGNVRQWIETFEHLKSFGNATFIPGHGEPAPLSEFEKTTLSYLKLLDTYMTKKVEEGVDMQDAIDNFDQSAFSYLENFDDLAGRNANITYQEAERASFE